MISVILLSKISVFTSELNPDLKSKLRGSNAIRTRYDNNLATRLIKTKTPVMHETQPSKPPEDATKRCKHYH